MNIGGCILEWALRETREVGCAYLKNKYWTWCCKNMLRMNILGQKNVPLSCLNGVDILSGKLLVVVSCARNLNHLHTVTGVLPSMPNKISCIDLMGPLPVSVRGMTYLVVVMLLANMFHCMPFVGLLQ